MLKTLCFNTSGPFESTIRAHSLTFFLNLSSGTNATGKNLAMELYNYCVNMPDIPSVDMSFSESNVKAYVEGNSQRTSVITFKADKLQTITFKLPSGVNSMNITYTQNGDYLIPNIIIRKTKPLGHYGRLRKAYLEMHRPILFNELVLSDKLFEHCAEIDETARNRMELIVRSLAEQNGVTEQLKAENQMEWVRQMNACKAQAEEIVKVELIYD